MHPGYATAEACRLHIACQFLPPPPSLSLPRLIHSSTLGCLNAFRSSGESSEAEELKSLKMKGSRCLKNCLPQGVRSAVVHQRGHREGRGAPSAAATAPDPSLTGPPSPPPVPRQGSPAPCPALLVPVFSGPRSRPAVFSGPWSPCASPPPWVCLPSVFLTQLCGSAIPAFLPLCC